IMLNTKSIYLFAFLFLLFVSSCQETEVTPTPVFTQSLVTAVTYPDNDFEIGDTISLMAEGQVSEGVQAFSIEKSVNGGVFTQISVNITSGAQPALNDNSFSLTFEYIVSDTIGDNVSIRVVTINQANENRSSTYDFSVIESAPGTGGTPPLLRAVFTVDLGSQGSSLGSYLATRLSDSTVQVPAGTFESISYPAETVSDGVFLSNQAGRADTSVQRMIDITFGIAGNDGQAATGVNATVPALISPDERASRNFNNPMGSQASRTLFKLESSLSALDTVTAEQVAAIDPSDAGAAVFTSISDAAGSNVFSFVNQISGSSFGQKGYIRIISIIGSGADRTAQVEVLVQEVQ
ncbi:MAG: hypothetical protein AAFU64_02075, partial [Bacteroidota bacterium]